MRAGLRDRLGLPDTTGRGRLMAAAVIDSLGSGLFLPFAVLYFLATTRLSLGSVGLGLSAASVLVLPLVPVLGLAVDAFGAVAAIVASNIMQMAGFAAYLWTSSLWELILFALLVAAGRRLFWTANGALVRAAASPGDEQRWFGLLRALRNGGFGLGGALAAVMLGAGHEWAYHALAAGNAASFLAAALLIRSWAAQPRDSGQPRDPAQPRNTGTRPRRPARPRRAARPGRPGRGATAAAGYRAVLADRPFLLLTAVNFLVVLCSLVVDFLLAVYVTQVLHRPAWLAGALFAVNAIVVTGAQTLVTKRAERRRGTGVLRLAAAAWAASFLAMWFASTAPAPAVVPALAAGMICYTAAEMLAMPTINNLVLVLAPARMQGRYFAVQGLTWVGPQVLAPAGFAWLLGRGAQWPWIALLAACAAITGMLAVLRRILPGGADLPRPRAGPGGRAEPGIPAARVPAGPDADTEQGDRARAPARRLDRLPRRCGGRAEERYRG